MATQLATRCGGRLQKTYEWTDRARVATGGDARSQNKKEGGQEVTGRMEGETGFYTFPTMLSPQANFGLVSGALRVKKIVPD